GAASLVAGAPALAADAGPELLKLLDAFFNELLDHSPESVTRTGLDKEARAAAKWKLDGRSPADLAASKARSADQLRRLKAIDRSQLSGMRRVDYDSTLFALESGLEGDRFPY